MKLIKNLPLRFVEARTRALGIIRLQASTWRQSVEEATADVRFEQAHGRYDEFGVSWSVTQLSESGVWLVARLWVIRGFLAALAEELVYVLTGALPQWVNDEMGELENRMLAYAR